MVRRLVGYGRLEGAAAAEALSTLHDAARLYVNFFQPSFKLKSKVRDGAKVTKKYHLPLKARFRMLVAEGRGGSVATFPPPHKFFWAREIHKNLGYVWYRKDSDKQFGTRGSGHVLSVVFASLVAPLLR